MATGLNFQTQTIINSNLDPDSNDAVLFKGADGVLRIKRDFVFEKSGVKAIRRAKGEKAVKCKATIDFTKIITEAVTEKTYYRLDIYIKLEGSEAFIYSTQYDYKGLPFWLEFTANVGDTATTIAENVAKTIKKDRLFLIDKDLMKVTVNAGVLTLEGAGEYQRFSKIKLSTFDIFDDDKTILASLDFGEAIKVTERGKNAFGTYSQIIKDLRLPTATNYQWSHIRQVETPIVGAIYDQYIIEYVGPATNDGLACVGQKLETHTTHVFWVKNDTELITAWETALAEIDPDAVGILDENIAPTLAERVSKLEA